MKSKRKNPFALILTANGRVNENPNANYDAVHVVVVVTVVEMMRTMLRLKLIYYCFVAFCSVTLQANLSSPTAQFLGVTVSLSPKGDQLIASAPYDLGAVRCCKLGPNCVYHLAAYRYNFDASTIKRHDFF